MAFTVDVLPSASDELGSLPRKIQIQIKKKIDRLRSNALPSGAKILNDPRGYRRLKSGAFRILYKVNGNKITVAKIGPRKDVYRWLR